MDYRPCVHFVGFTGDEYTRAVRIFGKPDFIHPAFDPRARREFASGDKIIFAKGDEHQPVTKYNAVDYIEREV